MKVTATVRRTVVRTTFETFREVQFETESLDRYELEEAARDYLEADYADPDEIEVDDETYDDYEVEDIEVEKREYVAKLNVEFICTPDKQEDFAENTVRFIEGFSDDDGEVTIVSVSQVTEV